MYSTYSRNWWTKFRVNLGASKAGDGSVISADGDDRFEAIAQGTPRSEHLAGQVEQTTGVRHRRMRFRVETAHCTEEMI